MLHISYYLPKVLSNNLPFVIMFKNLFVIGFYDWRIANVKCVALVLLSRHSQGSRKRPEWVLLNI